MTSSGDAGDGRDSGEVASAGNNAAAATRNSAADIANRMPAAMNDFTYQAAASSTMKVFSNALGGV